MPYHIISYNMSYHIVSYHISYHIISYHIVSYHISSYQYSAVSMFQFSNIHFHITFQSMFFTQIFTAVNYPMLQYAPRRECACISSSITPSILTINVTRSVIRFTPRSLYPRRQACCTHFTGFGCDLQPVCKLWSIQKFQLLSGYGSPTTRSSP